jgi:hypothetical protein
MYVQEILLIQPFYPSQKIQPQSWNDPRIEVRTSPIHGKGIFANANIQKGETVMIWGGTLFTYEEILAGKALEHSSTAVHEGIYLGHTPEQGLSTDDYLNHTCDPNIWMVNETTWVARRNIHAGEEITADFAMYWGPEDKEWVQWECQCGSPLCRKLFTNQDWQMPELQERYGNHFSSYILESIRLLDEVKVCD